MDKFMMYFKRALLLDFACIAIALLVLYLTNKAMIPLWASIVGAIVALVLLIWSIACLLKGRKIAKQSAGNDIVAGQTVENDHSVSDSLSSDPE